MVLPSHRPLFYFGTPNQSRARNTDSLLALVRHRRRDDSLVTTPIGNSINQSDKIRRRDQFDVLHHINGSHNLNLDKIFVRSFFRVVGSCNGLLCISSELIVPSYFMFLWNPSIRKSVAIPKHNVPQRTLLSPTPTLGFGFDPSTNDYKIVRLVYTLAWSSFGPPSRVELFMLNTGRWEDISPLAPEYYVRESATQVYFCGAFHWVVSRRMTQVEGEGGGCLILLFDMKDEIFGEMNLPDSVAKNSQILGNLLVHHNLLTLVHLSSNSSRRRNRVNGVFDVWVMREYGVASSWTKLHSFRFHGASSFLCFWKNHDVVWLCKSSVLVFHDSMNLKYQSHSDCYSRSFYLDTDLESLVLLKESEKCSDTDTPDIHLAPVCRRENKSGR